SHPSRKVVTANHSAVYYQPDHEKWHGRAVQPTVASWAPGSFHQAARALQGAGLDVYAWVVLTHNQRLGTLHPDIAVTNAFGDRYPWALCAANQLVREYCTTLASEIAALPEIGGLELEACGWFGFEHLHAHDKTGANAMPAWARDLLSLCFCDACEIEIADVGLNPTRMRDAVRSALAPVFAGEADHGPAIEGFEDELDALHALRAGAADRLRAEVIAEVRAARPHLPVLLHTHPDPRRVGSNAGADCATLFAESAGTVLQCWPPLEQSLGLVTAASAAAGKVPGRPPIAASLLAVRTMGGRMDTLADEAVALRAAGASELRFYHAGLASGGDLRAMREAAAAWTEAAL
ncbi:MAG: hypothetical protein ACRDSS_11585, partial [Actinocrinis sp.]